MDGGGGCGRLDRTGAGGDADRGGAGGKTLYGGAGREGVHGAGDGEAPQRGAATAPAAGEVFPSLVARDVAEAEERYLASFEEGLARLNGMVDRAVARERSWLSRLRAGLVAFLEFFEDEPWRGQVLVGEARVTGEALSLRCRARVLGVLSGLLDDGAPQAVGELTGELMAAGVFAVVRARVLRGEGVTLVELAPALMAFIVAPYVGQAAATGELAKLCAPDEDLAQPGVVREQLARGRVDAWAWERALNGGARLPIRVTHRTTMVLKAIAAQPGVSNRDVRRAAGIGDEGQTSKLLARLAERGLVENTGRGVSWREPNAWRLTGEGERVLAVIGRRPLRRPRRRRWSA